MGLEDGDQAPRPELAQRRERRRDLGRVVGVVVVDRRRRSRCPLQLEAAQHPRETTAGAARRARRASKPASSSAASAARALSRLWRPGTAQLERAGPGASASKRHATRWPAGERRRGSPSAGSARPRAPAAQKRREGLEQLGARAPARVVVELDVGDHRDLGAQAQEAGVALVGLGDDPLALPPAGVGGGAALAGARQLAAEEEGRVGADGAQRVDEHPRGRRLAVGAGDAISRLLGAELGEQLAAVDDPLAALAGARELGVVLADRGRDDHLGVGRDGVGVVADARLEAGRPQALQVGARRRGRCR